MTAPKYKEKPLLAIKAVFLLTIVRVFDIIFLKVSNKGDFPIMKKIISILLLICMIGALLCSCAKEHECREVRTAEINERGELVIIFTDGTESIVGRVDGKDGAPGTDGKDGEDGLDGKDGEKGDKGDTGLMGPEGKNGLSIQSMKMNSDGNLLITYDGGTTEVVDIYGEIYLFGGKCGENAEWALYNGGILEIRGSGKTDDYEEGKAPFYCFASLINAVYVDIANELELGENILYGIDEKKVTYWAETTEKWVDMTASAPIYSTPDNTSEPIAMLELGTELAAISEGENFAKIFYKGAVAYIETKYTVSTNGSVVYDEVDYQVKVIRPDGAKLRTFPDATSASDGNTYKTVPAGTILNCTGVSKNGNWYRISLEGYTVYAYKSWVEKIQ